MKTGQDKDIKIDKKGEDRRQKRSGMMQDKATEGGDEEMSAVEEKEEK